MFSKDNSQVYNQLSEKLSDVKRRFIGSLGAYQHEFEEDKVLSNKLQEVRKTLQQEYSNTEVITEDMVSFYLGLSKLEREVKSK